MAKVKWNHDGERDLAQSRGLEQKLNEVAFTITAHAVPHSGVDTGRLINSMNHVIDEEHGVLVAVLGSNADTGNPVHYADYHFADREAPDHRDESNRREIRKSIPHPTRKAPTLPYTKAMDELGIEHSVEPGGFPS